MAEVGRPFSRRSRGSSRRSTPRSLETSARRPCGDAVRGRTGASTSCAAAGSRFPTASRPRTTSSTQRLFARVRAAFGGRLRMAVTGAAPVAPEILEFFWACGVPVMEGYGMTETASAISINTVEEHRFGTVGKPLPDVEVRIAGDGEILVRGANVFSGYHKRRRHHVIRRDRRRLAAHGRSRGARRGRLSVDHRPQEGHHHHRGRQEHRAGQPGERPQAQPVDLARGDAWRPAARIP